MTREKAKELLPIIKAFAEGETIEFSDYGVWKEVDCPLWVPFYKYRIKPKSDYSTSEIQYERKY